MVTSREGVQDEVAPDKLQQRRSPETGFKLSQSNQKGSNLSTLQDKSSGELQPKQSPDPGVHASPSDQEPTALSLVPVKVSDNSQPKQSPDSRDHTSESNQKKSSLFSIPVEVVDNSQVRESPDNNGSTPSIIPEKVPEDGYNWRKYGQKLVRGNEFTRSYYKCTHLNCPAKRQVERSHAGQITDTIHLGKHEHPKPQTSYQIPVALVLPIQAKRSEECATSIAEDTTSDAHGRTSHHIELLGTSQVSTVTASDVVGGAVSQSSGIRVEVEDNLDPDSKRLKRENSNVDETPVDKPNGEPRHVVQTLSEVDIVNDGYRWRKYGQKLVKGNPNPRSYYRCSSTRCPAKKHVERASHDPKVVITTYEGQHDHNMPPARMVTVNTARANTNTTTLNGESRSKAEENNSVGLDMVVHISAN